MIIKTITKGPGGLYLVSKQRHAAWNCGHHTVYCHVCIVWYNYQFLSCSLYLYIFHGQWQPSDMFWFVKLQHLKHFKTKANLRLMIRGRFQPYIFVWYERLKQNCMVKSYFFCLYKVTLWVVFKNKLGLSKLFQVNMVFLKYPQGQITTFSPFVHIIQVFHNSSLYIANNLKRALEE